MKVYTYLLKSLKDGSYYVGITSSLSKRLEYHNSGFLKSTAFRRPYELVYYRGHEGYDDARKHEKWLKKKGKAYKDKLAQLFPPV